LLAVLLRKIAASKLAGYTGKSIEHRMILLAQSPPLPSDANFASAILFYLLAALSAGSALGVVISRNIVRTAVFLLFTLVGVAGLYFLLAAEFLAAVQLVIYAGGTLILIVFGVMLTSKSPFSRFEPKLIEVIIASCLGLVLLAALITAIIATPFPSSSIETAPYPIEKLGQALLGDYLVPFEIASVLLLVVMIGAAYLAKGRRREGE
jgi:NADH-quinone oxidoreductase subunit J